MPRLDPAAAAQKWQRNYAASTESAKIGANSVTESPGAKAAANKAGWVAKMTSPTIQDKWAQNTGRVTTDQWRQGYLQKGIPRMAQGAQMGMSKQQAFNQQFYPYLQAGVSQLPPRGDLEQNLARGNQMARYNAGFRRS